MNKKLGSGSSPDPNFYYNLTAAVPFMPCCGGFCLNLCTLIFRVQMSYTQMSADW